MRTLFFANRHLLFLSIVVILVAGVSSTITLPRLEDPRITNRNPLILTRAPGFSAERVEALITEKIEDGLQEIEEIKHLESTSRAGISVVAIELDDAVTRGENERIFSKIRDRLGDVAPDLPEGASTPTLDDERDPVAYTLIVGVTSPREDSPPRMGLLTRLAERLADDLRNLRGTEIVRVYGDVEEEILVTLDHAESAALGLSPERLAAIVDSADAKVSAGTLRGANADVQIEVEGAFERIDRVRAAPVASDDRGGVTRLGDVADVRRSWREPEEEIALVDQRRGVLIAARMRSGEQINRWRDGAGRAIDDLRAQVGEGVGVEIVFDQSAYTTSRLVELALNLLAGVGVVSVVVLLTMGWRAALMVGLAAPLTVSAALFGIQLSGGALHQMSIFGMIIALGLLIDNAIVVVDETRKRVERGMGARESMADTIGHLGGPLLASTLTTILAFAPIVLLPGNAGDFVGYIGGSVILAIGSSFLIAMTIIAAMAARYGRFDARERETTLLSGGLPGAGLSRAFARLMRMGLRAPLAVMVLAAAPPLVGFSLLPTLGNQFFPPVDRDMCDLRLWMPERTSIERTRRVVERIDAALRERADVERVHWLVGGSFPSVYYNLTMNQDRSPHYAQAVIDARSAEDVKRLIPEVQAELDEAFPEAQIVLRSFGQGPPIPADIEFRIFGPSVSRLQDLGEQVRGVMAEHPDVLHTRATMPRGEPKLWLRADEDETRLIDSSLLSVAGQLRGDLDGVVGGSMLEDLEEMPVRIRTGAARRSDVAPVASTLLPIAPGAWAPLETLGTLELRPELGGVTRYDSERCNSIEGYTREGALPIDVTMTIRAALEASGFSLPEGYRMDLGGAVEQDSEAVGNLLIYAPVLGTLMVSILVLTFRSVRLALVLGAVAGLSVGLALLATWSISFPISFNTILGTFGLIGVALNDSIVVIASIREDARARRGNIDAIVAQALACSRHVISTTLTTIGGFLPLLIFVGGEFWPSLAIVLAGGVGGATLLALVFVPAAYALLKPDKHRAEDSEAARA